MTKINRTAYEALIREDLMELANLPHTLERDHIEQVLKWSVDALYPKTKIEVPNYR